MAVYDTLRIRAFKPKFNVDFENQTLRTVFSVDSSYVSGSRCVT